MKLERRTPEERRRVVAQKLWEMREYITPEMLEFALETEAIASAEESLLLVREDMLNISKGGQPEWLKRERENESADAQKRRRTDT